MIYLSRIIPTRCIAEVCKPTGCDAFVCFDLEQSHFDSYSNRVIYDKATKNILICISLSPVLPLEAFKDPEGSTPVILGDEGNSALYVSLQWLAGKNPPTGIADQYKHIESIIIEAVHNRIGEVPNLITHQTIHPGTDTIQ
jgi:hypothetical protein